MHIFVVTVYSGVDLRILRETMLLLTSTLATPPRT